jgi:hypothetical protein
MRFSHSGRLFCFIYLNAKRRPPWCGIVCVVGNMIAIIGQKPRSIFSNWCFVHMKGSLVAACDPTLCVIWKKITILYGSHFSVQNYISDYFVVFTENCTHQMYLFNLLD